MKPKSPCSTALLLNYVTDCIMTVSSGDTVKVVWLECNHLYTSNCQLRYEAIGYERGTKREAGKKKREGEVGKKDEDMRRDGRRYKEIGKYRKR